MSDYPFQESDSDENENTDLSQSPGLALTVQNPHDTLNLYNTHSSIFYHYMDVEKSAGRLTEKMKLNSTTYRKTPNFLHPMCPLSFKDANNLRKKWVDALAAECLENNYALSYFIVCPADESIAYCKIVRRYLKYLRYEHAFFNKATFVCLPRFYMTNIPSTSYIYYEENKLTQTCVQFFENHADFVDYDMGFPKSISLHGINVDSYTRTHRFMNPYVFSTMKQIQELSKQLHVKNFVFYLGANKDAQVTSAQCFAIDHYVTMLIDGNETKGYEYLQQIVEFNRLFDEFAQPTEPGQYKVQKLCSFWICWKGHAPFNTFIEKWAKMCKNGDLSEEEAWKIYKQYVQKDKDLKNIKNINW
ncbi:Hypothetical_protein [Hexamita inflata]|uniref:Hypothetical_protein n=1 Tax=Hexamita inflata TaxID=28002 RepID=A0AA86UG80_9EUKA|nr:Hypothetical protein HINF_LOCUS42254 [Hexamita inflata]